MLKKNIDLYNEKYKNIDKDQIERIKNYLNDSKFSEKDLKKFKSEFDRIINIDHEIFKIVIYGIPESTPRPRYNFNHGNFYVKNARSNNEFLRVVVNEEKDIFDKMVITPCELTIKMYFPIPSNMSKVDTLLAEMGVIKPPINKDWDNLGKTYSDMIQKWLLLNDSLITRGVSEKYWSLKPRVEIYLEYLTEFDCKYNKKLVENSKLYQDSIKQ